MERSRKTNFQSLSHSILSQQLSTKAAATITSRVTDLAGGRLTPESVVRLSESKLRGAGCSHAKSRALQELAEASLDQRVPMKKLHLMSDGEIFDALLPLFGIGRWTVEMFLIFQLGRSDVWPVGDLGVRRGWERIHKMKDDITPELLFKRGEKFAPYRSHVAWFCWRALDL
jgi:DNA-3-methyladenine glycosylase II